MEWKGTLRLVVAAVAVFALTATVHATAPLCPVTSLVPSGAPVATLVVQVNQSWCFTTCPGPDNCCTSSAASIDLPAGQYLVTVSGQECSTESPPCNSDGTPGGPSCIRTSDDGVCSGETNACIMCDPGVPGGGPVLINHAGGKFYAWRNDCFGFDNFGIFTFEFFSVPLEVPVDIKPQSCPNPINTNSKGVVPVAIVGTASFDVTQVDVSTVQLEGVSPLRSAFKDTATPFSPFTGKVDCDLDCTTAGPDGIQDLVLHFDTQTLVAALGTVSDQQCLVLELTGNLLDGTPIMGEDVVRIIKKK